MKKATCFISRRRRLQDWLRMVERVLKLSIPCLYWWLAMFYTLFDLWLNILAEVLRFVDREFYKVRVGAALWVGAALAGTVWAYGTEVLVPAGRGCPLFPFWRQGLIWKQARSLL